MSNHAANFLEFLSDRSGSRSIRVDDFSDLQVLSVFGQNIHCGRILFVAEHAIVLDPDEARKKYLEASDGELVAVRVHCKGPCSFIHADQKGPQFEVSEDSVKRCS